MNIEDSIVNTYAWINATSNSRQFINIIKNTATADMVLHTAIDMELVRKMIQVIPNMMECPAIMLAKSRIIRVNGLVKIPNISINAISGFIHNGTSGQRISFQYSLFPNKLTAKKVHNAKVNVTAIFPVR